MNLTSILGTNYPLIQAPMAGAQDSGLAIAVSRAGALGSLPAAMLDAASLRRELQALQSSGLSAQGLRCLDVGQSTGGFTDCLLQQGAAQVVGLDVGHGQLHPRLRDDARVVCVERINARELEVNDARVPDAPQGFDLVVGDLSFISLTLVLPALLPLLKQGGALLMLVKPQFELQPSDIGKGGLVKDEASYVQVEARLREACAVLKLDVLGYWPSAIAGGDGNKEFWIGARRA